MTKIQHSWLTMCLAVLACLDRFAALWNTQAALLRRRNELGEKLDLIKAITEQQQRDRTGITVDKDRMAGLLVDGMLAVAGPLRALAADRTDADLRQRSVVSRTSLLRLRQNLLEERANSLYALAVQNQAILIAEYGLTLEILGSLETRRVAFKVLVTAPRSNMVERTRLTELLDKELRSCTEVLKEFFDPIVAGVAVEKPDFAREYRLARALVKPAVRRKKAKGETKAEAKAKTGKQASKRSNGTAGASTAEATNSGATTESARATSADPANTAGSEANGAHRVALPN